MEWKWNSKKTGLEYSECSPETAEERGRGNETSSWSLDWSGNGKGECSAHRQVLCCPVLYKYRPPHLWCVREINKRVILIITSLKCIGNVQFLVGFFVVVGRLLRFHEACFYATRKHAACDMIWWDGMDDVVQEICMPIMICSTVMWHDSSQSYRACMCMRVCQERR